MSDSCLSNGKRLYVVKDLRTKKYYLWEDENTLSTTREDAQNIIDYLFPDKMAKYAKVVKVRLVEIKRKHRRVK